MKRMIYISFFALLLQSCLEEVDWVETYYDQEIVIEAVFTDEEKYHEITLSYTVPLDDDAYQYVNNAQIDLVDQDGRRIRFIQDSSKYISQESFSISPNISYHLEVVLEDGERFISTEKELPPAFDLEQIKKGYSLDDRGEGISIKADIITEEAEYFRYEIRGYRKIQAPGYSGKDLRFKEDNPFVVWLENFRDYNQVCYVRQDYSLISLFEVEDRKLISDEEVVFFNSNDPVIAFGYGAELIIYSLDHAAFEYYKALKAMALESDVFNQVQLGNLYSTVSSEKSGKRMLGNFELSRISKRPFVVKYQDFSEEFSMQRNKSYVNPCTYTSPRHLYISPGGDIRLGELQYLFESGSVAYVRDDENAVVLDTVILQSDDLRTVLPTEYRPYVVVSPRNCADCSALGTNVKPAFWAALENSNREL